MQAAEYGVRQAAGWESSRRSLQNSPPLVLAKPHRCLSKSVLSLVVAESLSRVQLIATLWTAEWQTPLSSTVSWSLSNSCLLSWWFYPTISSSATPFFCLQSFPASRSYPMGWLFTSGVQSIGASASASVLPMNIQGWFPLGLTGLISLQSKGLSRVFSNTTIQKHQFLGPQTSFWSNSHIHTWLQEKP